MFGSFCGQKMLMSPYTRLMITKATMRERRVETGELLMNDVYLKYERIEVLRKSFELKFGL